MTITFNNRQCYNFYLNNYLNVGDNWIPRQKPDLTSRVNQASQSGDSRQATTQVVNEIKALVIDHKPQNPLTGICIVNCGLYKIFYDLVWRHLPQKSPMNDCFPFRFC